MLPVTELSALAKRESGDRTAISAKCGDGPADRRRPPFPIVISSRSSASKAGTTTAFVAEVNVAREFRCT